ncbi:DNA damage-induced apoptosis suppressor protein isoform X1 [Danio rerio]|uniref:DNA damage-induced apoptosis suppressor n=1 Tax=Danio rerio TaxID=7955 RepID=E7FD93_DANRE|nr:DNA damage-induced apoptosis suppressor protein isoform X1 [Danio rerio]|eukprot:XP_005161311.1 DNA damage-induced apoptosis suppressor protein isoform X1 [Danio rerio]
MSSTRALVSCSILSLQDSCFVYPCCKDCLSRVSLENKRVTCGRCGFTCDSQNVDYRYRLSFKVSRNQDIFGVTVFGGCLNPFFGITAGGLQRYIELQKSDGKHTVQELLVKALEDCFIGRSVIFGLKVPCKKAKTSSLSGQFVACQIVAPCESLMGCTVIDYLKTLQQANSNSCHYESASNVCFSQQKNSQTSQSFDYTPPSCAQLNSLPSSQEFTISKVWQSPGLRFLPAELNNEFLQQSRVCDNIASPNIETRTSKCRTSETNQPKHEKLKDETQNNHRNSFSSSCDMFDSSAHFNMSTACDAVNPLSTFSSQRDYEVTTSTQHLVRTVPVENLDARVDEKALYSHSGQDLSLNLEDAPLSESLQDFVEPPISEIIETRECSAGEKDKGIQEQNGCCQIDSSVSIQMPICGEHLTPPMCSVNIIERKESCENDCLENPETTLNPYEIPRFLTTTSSRLKGEPFSSANNRLSFSNKKELCLNRKIPNSPSVAFCSVNHEKGKYFRHCTQSELHSVNCKVKQELIVFDDHEDKYNCSVDLFASGQSGMDMNLSDVTEISKVNEQRSVNTLEPGVSGPLLFSPCLQSTPVSHFQHSCGPKTGRSRKRVGSLCSIKCEFKTKTTDLCLSDKRLKFDQMPNDECIENTKCNLSATEWSRDLFENSF